MQIAKYLKDKNVLITGGTGSFGYQIATQLLNYPVNEVVIFSRDEKKQYDMREDFSNRSRLKFIIGDVRDYPKIHETIKGINIVYHAAALKQVPNCEFHPLEAVKTNILGAENVRRAAIENRVDTVVTISTDKAVKPINVMGMTKAIQEKLMLDPSNSKWSTKFLCVRYGNVIGSRGSVIPFFIKRIKENQFLPITDFQMTRFLLTLKQAIALVFKATITGEDGQLFVKKIPACKIIDLAHAVAKELTGKENYPIKKVGIRPGEKIHEVLVSEEEMRHVIETKDHYVICPYGKLKRPRLINKIREYTSNNTRILNREEIMSLWKTETWWDKE